MALEKNPPWSRDELILALDLYFKVDVSRAKATDPLIIELSELLNKLPGVSGRRADQRFRNPNGVRMKLMNFRRIDPSYSGRGLSRGAKLEFKIWDEFSNDRELLHLLATTIGSFADSEIEMESLATNPDIEPEASEGNFLTRVHKIHERNPGIVERKKKKVLSQKGELRCEVCDFCFEEMYGERGKNFIECHHKKPLIELRPGDKTRLKDLALLCSNCHIMIHRHKKMLTLAELKGIIKQRGCEN